MPDDDKKQGWFERWQAENAARVEAAAQRAYNRARSAGKIGDTEAEAAAFIEGWNGLAEYHKADRSNRTDTSAARPISLMFFMIGLMVPAMVGMLQYQGAPNLSPTAWYAYPFGVACLIAGVLLWRRANRYERRSTEKFNEEWGNA